MLKIWIKKSYLPDDRWSPLVTSREEFVEKLVIIPNFITAVPSDITEAFKTVTHLMAASYYYWPIYDEAMSKALLIMEMSLKIKAKKLGIAQSITTKGGKTQQKKLVELINEICNLDYLEFLKPDFDRARMLRNSKMHPDEHHFMGGFGKTRSNAMLFVNIINHLFSDRQSLQGMLNQRSAFQSGFENFKNALFILEDKEKRILVESVLYHRYIKTEDAEWLIMLLMPVLVDAFESLKTHKYPNPLVVTIREFIIENDTITGVDPLGETVTLFPTHKKENIVKLEHYYHEMKSVSEDDRHMYHAYISGKALWQIEEIIHNHCWL